MDDTSLRATFNEDAVRYERARPHYPTELFSDLIDITKLPDQAKLLEIGPGTGQATRPLAERGYYITGVELGHDLAKLGRHMLAQYPNVTITNGSFETTHFPDASFDLLYAATSFHWIKPEVKFTKAHQLLGPGGHLAVIHTEHVSDEQGDAFFHATHPIYLAYTPKNNDTYKPPYNKDLRPLKVDAALFEPVAFKLYPIRLVYNAAEYTDLLATYSPVIALEDTTRQKFLDAIADVIDGQFGGSIEKHFTMTLNIARKKPAQY
jgi:SAM-dependent methyltransferase